MRTNSTRFPPLTALLILLSFTLGHCASESDPPPEEDVQEEDSTQADVEGIDVGGGDGCTPD